MKQKVLFLTNKLNGMLKDIIRKPLGTSNKNIIVPRSLMPYRLCLHTFVIICFIVLPMHVYAKKYIVISKCNYMLYLIDNVKNDTLHSFSIGCGKEYGNKIYSGDNRTPEGEFKIMSIERSTRWTHDFKDGFGARRKAYGDWFLRLKVPMFTGIGIHGTCFPETIGTRCSEGCIRMNNNDLRILRQYVYVGMICIIESDTL